MTKITYTKDVNIYKLVITTEIRERLYVNLGLCLSKYYDTAMTHYYFHDLENKDYFTPQVRRERYRNMIGYYGKD
jgi:hypothetical protein